MENQKKFVEVKKVKEKKITLNSINEIFTQLDKQQEKSLEERSKREKKVKEILKKERDYRTYVENNNKLEIQPTRQQQSDKWAVENGFLNHNQYIDYQMYLNQNAYLEGYNTHNELLSKLDEEYIKKGFEGLHDFLDKWVGGGVDGAQFDSYYECIAYWLEEIKDNSELEDKEIKYESVQEYYLDTRTDKPVPFSPIGKLDYRYLPESPFQDLIPETIPTFLPPKIVSTLEDEDENEEKNKEILAHRLQFIIQTDVQLGTKGLRANSLALLMDSVDLSTGRVIQDTIDFQFNSPFSFVWQRFWYSDSKFKGILGNKNHLCFESKLEVNNVLGKIFLLSWEGRVIEFKVVDEDSLYFNRSEKLTLLKEKENYRIHDDTTNLAYEYISENASTFIYKLDSIRDTNGREIKLKYQGNVITSIEDSLKREFMLSYNSKNLLSSVSIQPKDKEKLVLVSYEYDGEYNLIQVKNSLDQYTLLEYNNAHLLTKNTVNDTEKLTGWLYDEKGRCVSVWNAKGALKYNLEYAQKQTKTLLGDIETFYKFDEGFCREVLRNNGSKIRYTYTLFGEIETIENELGEITGFTRDFDGNITNINFPDDTYWFYKYSEENKLQIFEDSSGIGFLIYYDIRGRLVSLMTPDKQGMSFTYNENNLISEVRTTRDFSTPIRITYDEYQNPTKITFPNETSLEWSYDFWGNCVRTVDVNNIVQRFDYDSLHRLNQCTLRNQMVLKFGYNLLNQLESISHGEGSALFSYTSFEKLEKLSWGSFRYAFEYTHEKLATVQNAKKELYSYRYDTDENLVGETTFLGVKTEYIRTVSNSIQKRILGDGSFMEYEYDTMGRVTTIRHSSGVLSVFNYDRSGYLTEATNEYASLKFNVESDGRILAEKQNSFVLEFEYDRLSKKRKQITTFLGVNIKMEYNGLLSQMKVENEKGGNIWNTLLEYNDTGQLIKQVFPFEINSVFEYNSLQQPIRQILSHDVEGEFRNIHYLWGGNGKISSYFDTKYKGQTRFTYNSTGHLVREEFKEEDIIRAVDGVGNIFEKEHEVYGKGGNILEKNNCIYKYDALGNLIHKKEPDGKEWFFEWHPMGWLSKVIRPDKEHVLYEYDALGRRITKIFNNQVTRWMYDGKNPLIEWTYPLEERQAMKVHEEWGVPDYDQEEPVKDPILWVFLENTATPIAKIMDSGSTSIISNYAGIPIEMNSQKQHRAWDARLDCYGRILRMNVGNPKLCPFRFPGQYEDVETGLYYNLYRYYNPETGTYISPDPLGLEANFNTYAYVKDPLIMTDPMGLSGKPIIGQHYYSRIENILLPKTLISSKMPTFIFPYSTIHWASILEGMSWSFADYSDYLRTPSFEAIRRIPFASYPLDLFERIIEHKLVSTVPNIKERDPFYSMILKHFGWNPTKRLNFFSIENLNDAKSKKGSERNKIHDDIPMQNRGLHSIFHREIRKRD